MAKLNGLQLVNRLLPKFSLSTLSTLNGVTGKNLMLIGYINEAQTFLAAQTDWYSLYKMRRWSTVTYTNTTFSFTDGGASADSIDDSDSAFVTQGFSDNQTVLVSGGATTANNGQFHVDTVTAGSLTLQTSHVISGGADTSSITITGVSYPVATDHSRTIDLMDTTNNHLLIEDDALMFDLYDPDGDYTGNPLRFTVQGSAYRLDPIPAGDYNMLERYWKTPTVFSAATASDTATSDLPLECENLILYYAEAMMAEYLREFERADRLMRTLSIQLKDAKIANKRQINKMRIMGDRSGLVGSRPGFPRLPTTYDRRYI